MTDAFKVNTIYRGMHCGYWMLSAIGQGYCTYYLAHLGFSASEIGLFNAVFSTLAALLQPAVGRLADRSQRFNWQRLMLILALCCEIVVFLVIADLNRVLTALCYCCVMLIFNLMMPLVNVASFSYPQLPYAIDFGIGRGLGSLFYALLCLLLAALLPISGDIALPLTAIVCATLVIICTALMPKPQREDEGLNKSAASCPFIKLPFKYPAFFVMVGCSLLLMSFHNMFSTFLLQIVRRAGGEDEAIGYALGLAGFTEIPVLFLISRLAARFGSGTLLVVAGLSYILRGVLFLLADNMVILYVAQFTQFATFALYAGAVVYFSDECMEPEDKTTGQAFMSMTFAAGMVLGNLAGGYLIDYLGVPAMLWAGIGMSALGAALAALAVMMLRRVRQRVQAV